MRQEFGGPLQHVFRDFDERAFAAASIGQVHRATTVDGDDVAVKIQYPGVAEAVDTDLRNATLLLPLVKRLAPGLDAKALAARDARTDRRGARLRARGAEPAPHRAAAARTSLRPRAPCPHEPLDPARAGVRVRRGGALRGRAPRRRGAARPLRRDCLPALLRVAVSRPDRARRPPPRQLPAVPRRPGLLPGLRPAARRRRLPRGRRAGDRPCRPRRRRGGPQGGPWCGRLSARQPRGRRRRRLRAEPDANGDQVVRRPGRAPLLPGDARRDSDRERPEPRSGPR